MKADQIEFKDDALMSILREYTKEAGVRSVERTIATIMQKNRDHAH